MQDRFDETGPSCRHRVGLGFDFHRFVKGRDLILGGVHIPHSLGLDGHSDADVLVHAVTDALLGAAALPDIGSYFPDTDPRYQDVSSLYLLDTAYRLVRNEGFQVVNVDVVVMAQEPPIKPHREAIQSILSRHLGIPVGCIGIKATTMEQSGAVGRGEGIAVQSVVLISG